MAVVVIVVVEVVQGGEDDGVEDLLEVLLRQGATFDVRNGADLSRDRHRFGLRHGTLLVIGQLNQDFYVCQAKKK